MKVQAGFLFEVSYEKEAIETHAGHAEENADEEGQEVLNGFTRREAR